MKYVLLDGVRDFPTLMFYSLLGIMRPTHGGLEIVVLEEFIPLTTFYLVLIL